MHPDVERILISEEEINQNSLERKYLSTTKDKI